MDAAQNRRRVAFDLANKGRFTYSGGGHTRRALGMLIERHPKKVTPSGRSAVPHRGNNSGPRVKNAVRAEHVA